MGSDLELVRRLTEDGYVGGRLDAFDEVIADGFVDNDPAPGLPGDKQGMLQAAEMVLGSFDNRTIEHDDYMETTDGRIVTNWTMRADHTGEVFGIPATNASVVFRGMDVFRCADGQIVEHWGVVDMSDLMEKAMGAG